MFGESKADTLGAGFKIGPLQIGHCGFAF